MGCLLFFLLVSSFLPTVTLAQRRVQIRELHGELVTLAVKILRESTLSGQKDRKKGSLGAKEYVEDPPHTHTLRFSHGFDPRTGTSHADAPHKQCTDN